MNSTIFDWLEASLLWFAGLFGLYGAIWIIFQYRCRKILNNIAGLIIYAIAYADIVHSDVGIYNLTGYMLQFDNDVMSRLRNAKETIFIWSSLSVGLLIMLLASNTLLIVRYGGSAKYLDRFRFVYLSGSIVLPFLLFFIPVSISRQESLFMISTRSRENGECATLWHCDFQRVYFATLLTVSIFFSIISYLLSLYAIKYSQEKHIHTDHRSERAKHIIAKLIQLYSLSLLIGWIPYLIRYWVCLVVDTFVEISDEWFQTLNLLRSFTAPLRGYMHALAVHIVNRSSHNIKEKSVQQRIFNIMFLISTNVTSSHYGTKTAGDLTEEKTVQDIEWELSLNDSNTFQSLSRISQI